MNPGTREKLAAASLAHARRRASADPSSVLVKRLRTGRGLTLDQAAELADVSLRTWCRVEAGQEVSERTARRIARALGIQPDQVAS